MQRFRRRALHFFAALKKGAVRRRASRHGRGHWINSWLEGERRDRLPFHGRFRLRCFERTAISFLVQTCCGCGCGRDRERRRGWVRRWRGSFGCCATPPLVKNLGWGSVRERRVDGTRVSAL